MSDILIFVEFIFNKFHFEIISVYRYWLQTGTQVQVCTVTASNVIISCVYLNEGAMPGPISIDVDAPTEEPFRVLFK